MRIFLSRLLSRLMSRLVINQIWFDVFVTRDDFGHSRNCPVLTFTFAFFRVYVFLTDQLSHSVTRSSNWIKFRYWYNINTTNCNKWYEQFYSRTEIKNITRAGIRECFLLELLDEVFCFSSRWSFARKPAESRIPSSVAIFLQYL